MPEITLEQLLQSRENRAAFQQKLIRSYELPLVSFTVNMPGPVKLDSRAVYIFERGVVALRERLAGCVMYLKLRELETGCEGFFVIEDTTQKLKRITADIEQCHGLGRLFDMDVLAQDGVHISRESVGFARRACLLCSGDAAACARSRAHSLSDLHAEIDRIIARYKQAEGAADID